MIKDEYNLNDCIFSLDIGTRSIIGSVGVVRDKKINIICEKYKEHEERAMVDGQIHDINLVAKTVGYVKKMLEDELGIELKNVSIAAAGRFLKTAEAKAEVELAGEEEINKDIIRGVELSAVKLAEKEINDKTDGKMYCVGYSVKNYYLNSYVISSLLGHKGEVIGAEVIATFLPKSVVESLYTVMSKVELNVTNLTLEPIAAIEAAVPQKLRLLNIALVDIGAGTSDIAISSKETISAYGMVPIAGDESTEAIAQEYLVDFNTAEKMKREIGEKDNIEYTDVLGIDNTTSKEEILKVIKPTVMKLAEAISKKIIECNGNKPPAAVFLVGGGAHTPLLIDELSEKLGLDKKRIAIKDRNAVEQCVSDNSLGSAGVTVLGIALTAMKKLGDNFMDIYFNGEVVSLFNSHKNTVIDVLLQACINPSFLIGRNGKSLRFLVNGKKRLVFGTLGKNAIITVNGAIADTETEVSSGDDVNIEFAKNGEVAKAKISDIIEDINEISCYIDEEIVNLAPIIIVNGNKESLEYDIQQNDDIQIIMPKTVFDVRKYVLGEDKKLYKDGFLLNDEVQLVEGENYFTYDVNAISDMVEEYLEGDLESEEIIEDNKNNVVLEIEKEEENPSVDLKVTVNDEEIILKGKESYVVVEIFDYIDFDLTALHGKRVVILINGIEVNFTEKLKENDIVKVYWEQ